MTLIRVEHSEGQVLYTSSLLLHSPSPQKQSTVHHAPVSAPEHTPSPQYPILVAPCASSDTTHTHKRSLAVARSILLLITQRNGAPFAGRMKAAIKQSRPCLACKPSAHSALRGRRQPLSDQWLAAGRILNGCHNLETVRFDQSIVAFMKDHDGGINVLKQTCSFTFQRGDPPAFRSIV